MFASPKPLEVNGSNRQSPVVLISEAARLIAKSKRHAREIRKLELSLQQTIEELKATVKIIQQLLQEFDRMAPHCNASLGQAIDLTNRELTVWKLIAQSYSSRHIAEILGINPKTVAAHRANLMTKLGVHDVVTLTRLAIRSGIAQP
jgi:DNA-binding CsgD family transcriptional regulator